VVALALVVLVEVVRRRAEVAAVGSAVRAG
jgi:hypothetical protein